MMQILPGMWWLWATFSSVWGQGEKLLGAVATAKSIYDMASFTPSTRNISRPTREGGGFITVDISEFYYTRRLFKYTRTAIKWAWRLFLLIHACSLIWTIGKSISDERKAFKAFANDQTDTNTACEKNPDLYVTPKLKASCTEAKAFVDNPFTPSFYWNIIMRIWGDLRTCAVIGCMEIQETAKASTKYFFGWLAMSVAGFLFYGLLLVFAYDLIHYWFFYTKPKQLKSFEKINEKTASDKTRRRPSFAAEPETDRNEPEEEMCEEDDGISTKED